MHEPHAATTSPCKETKMDDSYRDLKQFLLDDAILFSGIDGVTIVESFKIVLGECFPGQHQDSLRKAVYNRLFAAHCRDPFVLDEEVAIPHLPWNVERPTIGWFRSTSGITDTSQSGHLIRIIFFAIAPEQSLKHLMASACQILKDHIFRREFKEAATARAFRLALAAGLERQIARAGATTDLLQERANFILGRYGGGATESTDVYIDNFFVRNSKGIHARVCARIVLCVEEYDCDVVIFSARGESVSGQSIMGLMMLDLKPGHVVEVVIRGRQAKELGVRLAQLFDAE